MEMNEITTVVFVSPKRGDSFHESVSEIKAAGGRFLPIAKVWAVASNTNQDDPCYRDLVADLFSFATVVGEADVEVNDWTYTMSTLERLAKKSI
jgi:hypothetical protein